MGGPWRPDSAPLAPLPLPPWPHGGASSAADTVLMFRGDPRHRMYGTGPLPTQAPELLWERRLEPYHASYYGRPHTWAGTGWTGQAVAYGGFVFVGSVGRGLYAFRASDGALGWHLRARRMFKASACYWDGALYIGNVDNRLRCVDARTGHLRWQLDTGRDLDSSACVVDGRLFVAGETGRVRCLDPTTGARVWEADVGGVIQGDTPGSYGSETSPAVDGGQVFTATFDGKLHCLNASDGTTRWVAVTGADTDASPVLDDTTVYVASEEEAPYVAAYNREDGRLRWRRKGARGFWATPALVDGHLVVPDAQGTLHCLEASTGAPRWTAALGAPSWSSPAVVDGQCVLGGFDGILRSHDLETGRLVWKLDLGGRMHSTPCIVGGRIFIGTGRGSFYGLGAS